MESDDHDFFISKQKHGRTVGVLKQLCECTVLCSSKISYTNCSDS